MLKGFYAVYIKDSYGEKWVANFQDINNVRDYIEANSNLDFIKLHEVNGKSTPTFYDEELGFLHEYAPITEENADGYYINTQGFDNLLIKYIPFDD